MDGPLLVFPELPASYVIQTWQGAVGILQITGFTNNPPGVKIRYKLVQNGVTYPDNLFLAMNSASLDRVPPIFLLRPTIMPTNSVPGGERLAKIVISARGKTVKELIATVWSQKDSALKIIFGDNLPDDKY